MSSILTGIGFLIIGASQFAHNTYLISTLHDRLLEEGASVVTYGACASIPGGWVVPRVTPCGTAVHIQNAPVVEDRAKTASSWSVTDLIRRHHPQVVVIGIADTLAAYGQPTLPVSWIKEQIHVLTSKIASENVGCIWLGTSWGNEGGPFGKNFARVKELSDLLATSVAPCEYVDSLKFSKPGEWPTYDGQHHTTIGYELWGAAATKAIMQTALVKRLER